MSNPESDPHETVCEAHDAPAIEIIEPRQVPLGGVRAMNVRRTMPQRARSLIGAWCFVDHYGPDDVTATGGMDVAAHPHTGLQTVSWLFSGEIEHRDSAGFHAFVRPGELNLMTAGNGISHSERSTPQTTVLHGAQLWVALPEHTRNGARGFEHYAPSVLTGDDWRAQVFLGTLLGDTSPVNTHTPLVGAELRLDAGAQLEFDIDATFEHGILVDSGDITVTRVVQGTGEPATAVRKDELAYIPTGATRICITAAASGARLLLIGGEPFGEQIVMWWNFIGRSHDEIMQARADWQAELAARGVADVSENARPTPLTEFEVYVPEPTTHTSRFGLPDGEPEPPLPAPAAPIARLVPRTQ